MILILCSCGLAVSQALSWERWVASAQVAAPPTETRALPLPRVRLVKDGLDAMPDKCDECLFGTTWYCGIACQRDNCSAHGGEFTLSRSLDPAGYQRIRQKEFHPLNGDTHISEWRVDRKWTPAVSDGPLKEGRMVGASCNGKTNAGFSNLSVNLKNLDGSDRQTDQVLGRWGQAPPCGWKPTKSAGRGTGRTRVAMARIDASGNSSGGDAIWLDKGAFRRS